MDINWIFVLVCVVMSFVVGSIWFHPKVFGNKYAKWMKLPKPTGKMPEGMVETIVHEIISRVMIFSGLSLVFGSIKMTSVLSALIPVLLLWSLFVFPTQLSQIAWTNAHKKAVILITGSTLFQMLVAALLWFQFFA